MTMPDKAAFRPRLVDHLRAAEAGLVPLSEVVLLTLLLALADAEWAREEAAREQAATLAPLPLA